MIGVPLGAAMSMPPCKFCRPVMGWVRQPKGDVTRWELAMGQRNPEALAVVWLLWLPEELLLPELPP